MEEQVVMDKLTIEHSVALTTIMCALITVQQEVAIFTGRQPILCGHAH